MSRPEILERAAGRWPEILCTLGGLRPEQLCRKEGPCPSCERLTGDGGQTRFRWIDDTGDGRWYCSYCAGPHNDRAYDVGFNLLTRLRFGRSGPSVAAEGLRLLSEHLGETPAPRGARSKQRKAAPAAPAPPARQTAPTSERQAWARLVAAGQTAEDELFSPSRAKGRAYSSRWLRWCEQVGEEAGGNELIDAALLEAETAEGAALELEDVVKAPPADQGQPRGEPTPLTLVGVRSELTAALADGASRADLQGLLVDLGQRSTLSPAALAALLRALEQEQQAAAEVEAEASLLAVAADREEISAAYLSLAGLFPADVAQAISARVRYLPADDICAAGIFLAAAASVVKLGTELVASRVCDFRVPLNLYAAMVGASGRKKTPPWKLLLCQLIKPIEIDLARQNRSAVEGWKAENQGKKPLERSEPPRPVFLSCSQFTGESLTRQLATQEEHGLGFLINREELSGLLGDVNAYRGGRGSDREQLLEAFDGSGASTLRVSEESGGRFYGRCQLSIFGTIQPRVLQQLVSETDGDASGLWARFLFLPVPDRVIPIPLADDESEVQEMEAARLLLEGVIGKIWRMPRKSLALDAAARAAFVGYEQRCQGDALRAELPAVSAAWGKAAGKVLRVAGLLHLIHIAAGADLDGLVPEATLLAAANLVDHLTGWSLGLHQAAAGASGASDLMRLVHRVAQAAGVPITWRDVSPKLSRKARTEVDSAAAGLAVDALVRLGVGVRGEGKRAGSWTYQATRNLPS